MDTPSATPPSELRAEPAPALLALVFALLFGLSLFALSNLRERGFEDRLNSDEPEWIAISILHWNQFFRGHGPGGAELEASARSANPWKQGVQHTTFGYMNPCLPKLIWGGVFAAAGHDEASPYAFQTFHKGDPELGREPYRELLEVMPLARRVVLVLAALSGALLCFVARATVRTAASARSGWVCGGVALALWVGSPLVHRTASYIRTDYFMLPFLLGLWWWTLARRDALAGRAGLRAALRSGLMAGLLGGLAVSSKLNGTLGLFAFAAAVLLHWTGPRRAPLTWPLAAIGVAALAACAVFFALNPLLWSGPIEGALDILARWDKLMGYFQDEWAPRVGTAVAHGPAESLALFFDRAVTRDEPLAAATGSPWASAWIVLGLGALALLALGRGPLARSSGAAATAPTAPGAARCSLCFVAALVLGTALWLPLDWERLWLPSVPAVAILGGVLASSLLAALKPADGK